MYKINEIAKLAGISTRTLRYYDTIKLLSPSYIADNNYRYYTEKEIDTLQQILFYKELSFTLEDIKDIITDKNFDFVNALTEHRKRLISKQAQIEKLLDTIDKTIQKEKGEIKMKNEEKFKGLIEEEILENEENYGTEIRNLYGNDTIDASYQKMRKMSKWEFNEAKRLALEINEKLGQALIIGDPSSDLAMELCELHATWIKMYWSTYTKEAHIKLVEMYTIDERFTAYYDKVGENATTFLFQAMKLYIKKDH